MIICIVSPGMEHDGNTIKTKSLGGSETAAIQLAEALAKEKDAFGNANKVTVFSPCQGMTTVNDVQYAPVQAAQGFISGGDVDVLIISRWQEPLMQPVNAKVVLYWCHDLALKRFYGKVRGIMYQIDKFLVMSQFQKEQYKQVYDLEDKCFEVIRNGIDLSLFPAPNTRRRDKGSMVYCARPERGLENLVGPGGIMERLGREGVPATLTVAYYDNTTPDMKGYYEYLWNRCRELPNVRLLGSLTKAQLYDLYSRAWLYIYPTEFEEISCISAMEAQACGLPFLTTPVAALKETLSESSAFFLDAKVRENEGRQAFVEKIKELLTRDDLVATAGLSGYQRSVGFAWNGVARDVINISNRILRSKTSDPARLYKHFLRMSDIEMCRLMEKKFPADALAFAKGEIEYVKNNYAFTESPEAYRKQYELVDGPIDETNRGASVDHYEKSEDEPRWNVLKRFVRENAPKFRTVLDFGCWIGHQTIRVANEMPHAKVHGIDVNSRNIGLAEECRVKYSKHGNVSFSVGDEMGDSPPAQQYDLVICNEVLEHVIDPYRLISDLERFCKPGGTIFITTPFGPWEAQSYDTFPYRCHIRHYEMQDILDVFGKKENLQAYYVQTGKGKDESALGHQYTVYTNNPERPTGRVNVERKMAWQNPRETLSVCMIAYNAEDMLHRCLKSVRNIADEIIIAIDPKTTDSTAEIAKQYGAKIIEGIDPIKNGFEVARNHSIKGAKGDWILWIDSDEELLQSSKVHKYLRSNSLTGYAVQQHHLSVDPPMAIKPDLPIRLFRNRIGVEFFGYVHEHPEIGLNKGIGIGVVLVDTWLAHDGYLTESIRRHRFLRNIDLVIIDRKKYPERNLGHFLWLRDLIHLIRYRVEHRNGQGPDFQCIEWAKEARALFEEKFLTDAKNPMLLEALNYYSEANNVLNLGHKIEFSVKLEGQEPLMLRGRFPNSEIAEKFIGGISRNTIAQLEGRYI